MTMFEVKPWQNFSITEREVEKTTANFVILPGGRREGLKTDFASWFPTAAEAAAFCIERLTAKSAQVTKNLREINSRLSELNGVVAGVHSPSVADESDRTRKNSEDPEVNSRFTRVTRDA